MLGAGLAVAYARRPEPLAFFALALPYLLISYALLTLGDRGGAGRAAGGYREAVL